MKNQKSLNLNVAILFFLIFSLSCNLSLPPQIISIPTQTLVATPVPLPPTIIETLPADGSIIPSQATITIFFSEEMNKQSVEAALKTDFDGGLTYIWMDDSTLKVAPKAKLPANTKITFKLSPNAQSLDGLAILEEFAFSYQTAGYLEISQTLPYADSNEISPDSAVAITFNQPVVPLGSHPSTWPAGFTLDPPVSGKGEWINTSTYIFHADPALGGGVSYTASVNPALVSIAGTVLGDKSRNSKWSFTTALPKLLKVSPNVADGRIDLDEAIEIQFNQPMDRGSVELAVNLSGPEGLIPGVFEWNEKSSEAKYKPYGNLQRDTAYLLNIGAGARSKGGVELGAEALVEYNTIPDFAVDLPSFPNGEIRPSDKGVVLKFSSSVADYSSAELKKLITIDPMPAYFDYYQNAKDIDISGAFLPGKSYKITFSADLKDRWGQALGQDYVFSFTEPDAPPSVSFGNYAPALFTRPNEPGVHVQAVNINTMSVSFGSMTLADFFQFDTDYAFREGYYSFDGQSWNISPTLQKNDNQPVYVQLRDQQLDPGLYFVNVESQEATYAQDNRRVLISSNLNVTMKTSPTEVLIWAVDLRTQQPVKNVSVQIYSQDKNVIASGVTNEEGLWQGPVPAVRAGDSIYAILGQPGEEFFGVASSQWNQGIASWDFGLVFGGSGPAPHAYLYTDRPIYRPGDTVKYRGIIKNWSDGRYTSSDIKNIDLTLYSPGGTTQLQVVTPSAFGTFNGEVIIPENAETGSYTLSVSNDGKDLSGGWVSMMVADYRKPEINLSAELTPEFAKSGETITATVRAEYFFGSPVADLPFQWSVSTHTSDFPIPGFNTGIQFMRLDLNGAGMSYGTSSQTGEGRTGADGTFVIPLENLNVDQTTEVTIEITASESGGFPVSTRASAVLHPEDFYIGVRPESWIGSAGSELGFDLIGVNLKKQPVSQFITADFQKVRWERTEGVYGYYNFTPIYTLVETKTVQSGADGKAQTTFTPPDAGTYMLDAHAGNAHTQTLIWVGGSEEAEWPDIPYQQIEITSDHDSYKPGDTAEIFVPNAFNAPVQALVTTERGTIKSAYTVTLPAGGTSIKLKLTEDSAPNIYASVTMLGPQGVDFRQGYINLLVEPSFLTLNVDLKAEPAKARPGDTVTIDLLVHDSAGNPVQGEFSMSVVDLAVLALADPNSTDIVPAFYDVQNLDVITSLSAAIYSGRLLKGEGGWGGGGGELLTLRSKFPDTAYWKADIVTDAQGKARVSFTLPDNLTTWEIDSRGLTKDAKVGQARVRITTSKDLMIRPQTPQFLVEGDHAELVAMVNNITSAEVEAIASLQAPGFILDDPALAAIKVTVPANGHVKVVWSGLVEGGQKIDAVFSVKAGDLQDSSTPENGPIPVLRYVSERAFSAAGVLTGLAMRQEIIALPRSFQPLEGTLNVELSPSLASTLLQTLKPTDSPEEPWNSEAIVSAFLPDVATSLVLKDSGLNDPDLEARLGNNFEADLRKLMTFHSDDGGWKWTNSSSNSDAYLTAYILFGLQLASQRGMIQDTAVISEAISSGRSFLFNNAEIFTGSLDENQTWKINRSVFFCYMLDQTGGLEDHLSVVDTLYQYKDVLDPWAQAMLAMILYHQNSVDERAGRLLSDIESSAIRSASGAHWESNTADWANPASPLFTTAMVLNVLAERSPDSEVTADAVRYLSMHRNVDGRWASSYENTWVILALNKYMQASEELLGNFTFSSELNGNALLQGQASGSQNMATVSTSTVLTQQNLTGANSLVINKADGAGKLYYRAFLNVARPVETAPAVEHGLTISREYFDCSGSECKPITGYQIKSDQSGRVKVKLTLTIPADSYYFNVQDYIPAGSDILNASLKTSQQGMSSQYTQINFDPADPFGDGWGWWYFNTPQIYDSHILWSADYLPAGTYVLSYTIVPVFAGEYRVLPAHAWQSYFPEVEGSTAGVIFEIKP